MGSSTSHKTLLSVAGAVTARQLARYLIDGTAGSLEKSRPKKSPRFIPFHVVLATVELRRRVYPWPEADELPQLLWNRLRLPGRKDEATRSAHSGAVRFISESGLPLNKKMNPHPRI